jgi:hypothetical protein
VSGLGESKAKAAREAYRPKLKKCPDLLVNPSLDEAFYIRLRSIKSSSASKANIDPVEKIYRNQTYKILDLVKPLMFLASRVQKKKKTKADSKAIRTALKLWAVLYHDVTSARRKNILSQIYPQNVGLLDDKSILPTGGDHLFGPKFTQALVDQVKTLNALENASESQRASGQGSSSHSGRNFDHPQRSSSSGGSHQNNSSNRYVITSLAFVDSLVAVSRFFSHVWSRLTLDPWVISTVSEGFRLEFISDPVQSFIQPNAPMTRRSTSVARRRFSLF